MLEKWLHHQKTPKEYISALVLSEDQIEAALWESTKSDEVKIITTAIEKLPAAQTPETDAQAFWKHVTDATDQAISTIETALPAGVELNKVVLGIYPHWSQGDQIKDEYLKSIKVLTKSLSLEPLGFVEVPMAAIRAMQRKEDAQPTLILVGVERERLTVTLAKIGKLSDSFTAKRSESIANDLVAVLNQFTDVEVLPSRIILYGTVDLEETKKTLLDYPWQKKANFLHVPKIETIPADFIVKAVAIASGSEIVPQLEAVDANEVAPTATSVEKDESITSTEVAEVTKDLGFAAEEEIDSSAPASEDFFEERQEELEDVEPVVPSAKLSRKWPRFRLPHFSLKLPFIPKIGMLVSLLTLLLAIGGGIWSIYWFVPRATITLLVKPETLEKTEDIVVDVLAEATDVDKKALPAREVAVAIDGTQTIPTTGSKVVGEKAKGKVMIYNKTQNDKTFAKGTNLVAGDITFVLDEEVEVTAATEGLGSLTYGSAEAEISAAEIGSEGNLDAGHEFEFVDFPLTSYSARNEIALAGGSSKEVAVVSRDDLSFARDAVITTLEAQAPEKISKELKSSEKLFDNSLSTELKSETFSSEVGEEVDELTINVTASVTGVAYNEADLHSLLESVLASSLPQNYIYNKEAVTVSVEKVTETDGGAKVFTSKMKVELLPELETAELPQKLAGLALAEAAEYLRQVTGVAGVEFDVAAPLSMLKTTLPRNSRNISIEVTSL